MRALAVTMVIAFHAHLRLPGGFSGVDVFFAISGFVITSTLLAELERTERVSLPRFYARRAKRLLPALAVLITFVALTGTLAAPAIATHMSGMTGVFASFFAANVYLSTLPSDYFSVSTQLDPLLHTWTLAVEEQFYLVFPALLFAAWWFGTRRGGRGRAAAFLVITVVAVESFTLPRHAAGTVRAGNGYYGSPARAWEFAAGCLIALSAPLWLRLPPRLAALLAAAGFTGIAYAALKATATSGFAITTVVPVASACALIGAGCVPNTISRLSALPPLTWVGDRSYSLYLWHWPLIVFARALAPMHASAPAIAAAVSIVPAWASYRFVENPVRHHARIRGRVTVAMTAACIAVPAAFAFGLSRMPLLESPAYAAGAHADLLRGCDSDAPYASPSRLRCVWRARDARGDIVLIGDSNAGHFTEPFVAAANRAGFSATVAAPSGCPFVQLRLTKKTYDYGPCNRFNANALTALIHDRPNLVVIAARSDLYLEDPAFGVARPGTSATHDTDTKQRLWAATVADEIRDLNKAGIPVVIIHPIAFLPKAGYGCAVFVLLTHRCGASLSRRQVAAQLHRALQVEAAAVRGHRAWVVSFENELCGRQRCSSSRDGVILYQTFDHLSVRGALTLTDRFSTVVISHARASRLSPYAAS